MMADETAPLPGQDADAPPGWRRCAQCGKLAPLTTFAWVDVRHPGERMRVGKCCSNSRQSALRSARAAASFQNRHPRP